MNAIKIAKSIINRPDYLGEKFSRPSAWIDLLLMADNEGRINFTISALATRWKWQRRNVKSFLDQLSMNCAITYELHNSGHSSMHSLTICNYASYNACCTDGYTDGGSVQKGYPLRPSPSPLNPPAPPYNPTTTPPISPSKNSTPIGQDASAYAREAPYPPTPFPYPTPFILSSVERNWCMGDPARIVEIKRRHLEENLKTLEHEFGMNEAERKKFLDYWCCPSQRNREEIRAEGDAYFDLRYRIAKWMDGKKPEEQKTQSRVEQYAQVSRNFSALVYELYNPNDTGAGNRSADSPDEQ